MLTVNLTVVFLSLREGLWRMDGWGRLISVASTAGLQGYAYVAPHAAATHCVVGLIRSLALKVARSEVTAAALWLCGPGSAGVNGQAIAIAGGEV